MTENNALETDKMIQQLQDAVDKARGGDDPKATCMALAQLGQAYLDRQEAPDALTQFEEALKIAQKMDDREMGARLFGFRGLALKMLGNYVMALQAFQRSKGMATKLEHDYLLCDSCLQIGILKSEMGNHTEAQESLTRALEIADKVEDGTRRMRITGAMADDYYASEVYDQALEYYGQAYEDARNLGNSLGSCTYLTKMANIALLTSQLKTAIEQYERALVIASAIENRGAEITILGGLFRAHALLKDERLTAIYGEKVVQLAGEIQHFNAQIVNLQALASFFVDQQKYDKALSYLVQGRKLAEQNRSPEWQLTMEVAYGTALYRSGDFSAAADAYKRALDFARNAADKQSEIQILGYLSAVQAAQELIPESIKTAERALELAREMNNPVLMGEQQMLLAFNYQDLNKIDQAIQYCQAAVASYKEIDDTNMMVKAQGLLAELQKA